MKYNRKRRENDKKSVIKRVRGINNIKVKEGEKERRRYCEKRYKVSEKERYGKRKRNQYYFSSRDEVQV